MNTIDKVILIAVGVFFAGASSVMFTDTDRYVKYDCRYSEISPDFPPQAREICRGRK